MKKQTIVSYAVGEDSFFLSAGVINGRQLRHIAPDIVRDNFTILYCIDGSGSYEDENGNYCKIQKGTLIQRFPNVRHTIVRDQNDQWQEFYIVLSKNLYKIASKTGIIKNFTLVHKKHTEIVDEKISALIQKISELNDQHNPAAAFAIVSNFLATFCREPQNFSTDPDIAKINIACELISHAPESAITGQQLAEKVGMGYHSFRSKFKKITGFSPNDYRIRRRIEKAGEMLLNTDLSIKHIALQLGFCDTAAFSHQFHSFSGMRPSSFRSDESSQEKNQ